MVTARAPTPAPPLFWTTLNFLPGALWIAVATTLGLEILRWWRRHGPVAAASLPGFTATAAWLAAVGFVAWSVPMGYTTPGLGPGPMIAWATMNIGWSFGFTALVLAVFAAVIAPPAHVAVSAVRNRPRARG